MLTRLSLPLIVANGTLTVMQLTDAWLAGQVGSAALAAILAPSMLGFLLLAMAQGMFSATTTLTAQEFGRGLGSRTGGLAWQSLYFALIGGLLVLALVPAAPFVFSLFPHGDAEVLALEVAYFQVTAFALVASIASSALVAFFVGVRQTSIVMMASGSAVVVNLFVSAGLVFGPGPLPALGIVGIGLGTLAGSLVELGALAVAFTRRTARERFATLPPALPSRGDQRRLLAVGGPAGLQVGLEVSSWSLGVTWLVGWFGTADVAAATVLMRCVQFGYLPAEAFAVASQTLVGSAIGRGDLGLAQQRASSAFAIVGSLMATVGLGLFSLREPIARAFTDDPEVAALVSTGLVIVATFQVFDAMIVSYGHALTAAGDTAWTMLANLGLTLGILGGGGLVVVWGFPELGSLAIWGVVGLYIAVQGLAFRARWRSGRWHSIELLAAA